MLLCTMQGVVLIVHETLLVQRTDTSRRCVEVLTEEILEDAIGSHFDADKGEGLKKGQ